MITKYEKVCLNLGISSTFSCSGLYIFETKNCAWISRILATSLLNGATLEITEVMLVNHQRISVSADDNHIH